jgi:hypothetical protein
MRVSCGTRCVAPVWVSRLRVYLYGIGCAVALPFWVLSQFLRNVRTLILTQMQRKEREREREKKKIVREIYIVCTMLSLRRGTPGISDKHKADGSERMVPMEKNGTLYNNSPKTANHLEHKHDTRRPADDAREPHDTYPEHTHAHPLSLTPLTALCLPASQASNTTATRELQLQ